MMYSGKYVNPVSGKTVKKKGEIADTVKELALETYSGKGHVTCVIYGSLLHKWATH